MNVRVMDQNRQKMTEKSEFREMRSFDLAIRRAYFKVQIRRNYTKNVVINRSGTGAGVEWLTPVPEVPGSILSRGAFRCGLEQVTFPQLLR